MDYWRIFVRLMSQDWKSHLVFPFLVAIIVEPALGFILLKDGTSVGQYIISREGLISHGSIAGIIITYLCVAVWSIHKNAKAGWTNKSGAQLNEILSGAKSFFATCTIPLQDWFHSDTQKYFSHLVKHKMSAEKLPQHRVLLFKKGSDVVAANEQYLDAYYAKTLVNIHQNYEIPLGYLEPHEIGEILGNFDLEHRAADWDHLKQNPTKRVFQGKISTLDFAVIGCGEGKYRAYTFDKSGDYIKVDEIEDPQPYVNLRNAIRAKAFNVHGLPNAAHDFAVHCGMSPNRIDQGNSFID